MFNNTDNFFSRVLVSLVALFFLVMGVTALGDPLTPISFFGLTDITPDFRNEVRAIYGGFGLAVCGVLILSMFVDELRLGVRAAIATSVLGMALGRVISYALESPDGIYPGIFLVVEVTLGAMLISSLTGGRNPEQ
jgi:hypothetical protein